MHQVSRGRIPLIAIDIPHPGATYFGANNYQAGLLAGRYLGTYAHTCWNGQVDEVLILELARAGALVGARSKGILAGLRETLHLGDSVRVISLDGDGQFKASLEKVRRYIRMSKARHVLVGAANDPSALGAVRAFQEIGRQGTCAIVGQNAEPDARQELRSEMTPLVASVAFFPERYGSGLVRLALDILAERRYRPPCSRGTRSSQARTWIISIRTTRSSASPAACKRAARVVFRQAKQVGTR